MHSIDAHAAIPSTLGTTAHNRVRTIVEALWKELLEVVRDNTAPAQRRPLRTIEYHVKVMKL